MASLGRTELNEAVPPPAPDLSNRDSLARLVYRRLREEIMSGLWKPGERLTIREQAERFRISPTPVREAMLQLTGEGALTLGARTFSVRQLTKGEFLEVRKIRASLEGLLTREAVAGPNPALADELAELHRELIEAKRDQQFETVMIKNRLFHFRIYDAARMPQALDLVESLWTRAGPYQHSLYSVTEAQDPAHHDHLRAIDAVRRGDADAAVQAIVDDITLRGIQAERAFSEAAS